MTPKVIGSILFLVTLLYSAGNICAVQSGYHWDEVTFVFHPKFDLERVIVHAKEHKVGDKSYFEFLKIKIGEIEMEVLSDLLRHVEKPDLKSFLLMSEEVEGQMKILLSVSPQWRGDDRPVYTFEIVDGSVRSFYKIITSRGEDKIVIYGEDE